MDIVSEAKEEIKAFDRPSAATSRAMIVEIERLTELNQKLYEFFKEGVDCAFTAADWYGADIQEKAVELGLMHKVEATEPCGENCMCEEIAGFPVDCYRPVSLQNNIGDE